MNELISCKTTNYNFNTRYLSQILLAKLFTNETNKSLKVLEIGSGPGHLFRMAQKLKLNWSSYSYEPDKFSTKCLRKLGVMVYDESFTAETKSQNTFDLIFLSHFLEHYNYTDFSQVLYRIKKMLTQGGRILIEVPNSPKGYFTLRGNDSPHLTFWTKKSLEMTLIKMGFKILFIDTVSEEIAPIKKKINSLTHLRNRLFEFGGKRLLFIIQTLRNVKDPMLYRALSSNDFNYGGDRQGLRCIIGI
jgi:SAM-dependent methyltransferase